jgi:MoxR-like ATPase
VFVEAWAIRAAAEANGLRLPDSVYANVAAALDAGKHLLLTGAPGSGKTTLALAVARAAAQAGHAKGATVVTGAPERPLLIDAAARSRWVVADELDQADPDYAFKPLSTLLAGVPVLLDGQETEVAAGWRIVATWNGAPPRGVSVLRRFAAVDVTRPPADQLRALVAQRDPVAQEAVDLLLALGLPVGAGVLREAANHIRARQAAVPTDATTLTDEAVAAYLSPLLDR